MSSNHLCTTYSPYIHSSIFIIYFHHLFTIYSLYIHLFIYLFITYSPYIHHLSNHLFIIYPFIYSVAGSSQAEFSGAASELVTDIKGLSEMMMLFFSLPDYELDSINHSIIITRGLTDSWSRTLEKWTSILSHLHRLVEAIDGLMGATVLKHISNGSQPQHLGSLASDDHRVKDPTVSSTRCGPRSCTAHRPRRGPPICCSADHR